ncbi:MAG: hypothetical protein ABFC80_01265 [Coriobacteriales bacterium]|nr:hypothetical protein [Actinomycetes bacterium]
MEPARKKTTALVIVVALVAAALGGLGVWLLTRDRTPSPATSTSTGQPAQESTSSEATSPPSSGATTPAEQSAGTGPKAPDDATPPSEWDAETGRFLAYIERIEDRSGTTYLGVDYTQLLTGEDAAEVYEAEGEEPLDFIVINESEKVRTWPVADDVSVSVATMPGHFDVDGYDLTFDAWRDMYTGARDDFPRARTVLYWITLEDGVITSIDEQYFP